MDDHYELTTPENVPVAYELAGLGSRFAAAVIDTTIIVVAQVCLIVFALLTISRATVPRAAESWLWAAGGLISFLITFGFGLFFEIVWSGQTPGKRIIGIRVVKFDGGPLTALAAVIRNVVRIADFLPAYYITGIVVMLIDRRARRLGDLAAGTIVVKERRDIAIDRLTLGMVMPAESEVEEAISSVEVFGRVNYDDYKLIKEYLLRRDVLSPEAAQALANRIAQIIRGKLGVEAGEESAPEFLARMGAEMERKRWE